MAGPYLVVPIGGDSNAGFAKYRDTGGADDAGSGIFQYKHDGTTAVANEPLDNSGGMNITVDAVEKVIGSTVALCRLLRDRGKVPSGYSILIVPAAWAGTAFLNYWATTGSRFALDGGGGITNGFFTQVAAAMATHASNRLWFFDWNHGANDGAQTQAQYQNNMIATFGEIRGTIATAAKAPVLVTGIPPDRSVVGLGAQVNLTGVAAAQANIGNVLTNSAYVDPTGLHSDPTNGYVHFHAAAHRGGVVTSSYAYGVQGTPAVDEGLTISVDNSIAGKKYAALLALGWKNRATWT